MEAPLLQIRGSRIDVSDDAEEIAAAARVFHDGWFLRFPGFLDAETLVKAQADIESGPLQREEHVGVGVEVNRRDGPTVRRFNFLLSQRPVLELIAHLTRVPRVGSFLGRIYRMESGGDHHDEWHDDRSRVAALSVNVGAPHQGGCLLMRRKGFDEHISIPNTTPGDAVLFRLSDTLEHRVTTVEGDAPKTAYAGWFVVEPDLEAELRKLRDRR